jgi:hypothetical protein
MTLWPGCNAITLHLIGGAARVVAGRGKRWGFLGFGGKKMKVKHRVKRIVEPVKRVCLFCKKRYVPTRSWQKYCCRRCQLTDYNRTHDIAGMIRDKRAREAGESGM